MEFIADFQTDHERIKSFNNLREVDVLTLKFNQQNAEKKERFLPAIIERNYPREGALIMKMTLHESKGRPTVEEMKGINQSKSDSFL
jgi:hypothetical protein